MWWKVFAVVVMVVASAGVWCRQGCHVSRSEQFEVSSLEGDGPLLPWRFLSYNSGNTTLQRTLGDILWQLDASAIGLQGTGVKMPRFEQREARPQCKCWVQGRYQIYSWPWADTDMSNSSCGAAVALNRKRFAPGTVTHVWCTSFQLQGRAGAVRVRKNGLYDFAFITIYAPTRRLRGAQAIMRELMLWLEDVLGGLPARCVPIIFIDLNGRLGQEGDGDGVVGPCGSERITPNGRMFKRVCSKFGLMAFNTFVACGHTWYGGGHSSRIDFVAGPITLWPAVDRVAVLRGTAKLVQAGRATKVLDHAPVAVDMHYRSWFDDDSKRAEQSGWCMEDVRQLTKDLDQERQLVERVDDWAGCEETKEAMKLATQERDVNAAWRLLNVGLAKVAREMCGKRRSMPADLTSATKEDMEELRKFRKAMLQREVQRRRGGEEEGGITWKRWWDSFRYTRLRQELREKRKKLLDDRRQTLCSQVREGMREHDWRMAWKAAYKIAARFGGCKRRVYCAAKAWTPTAAEWAQQMAKAGPDGGFKARPVWHGKEREMDRLWEAREAVQVRRREEASRDEVERVREESREDFERVRRAAYGARSMRVVPRWSVPMDIWKLTLWGDEGKKKEERVRCSQEMCERTLDMCACIKLAQATPVQWNASLGAQLNKRNGKPLWGGIRTVHLLDGIGKAWHWAMWQKKDGAYQANSYGFIPHRRREGAVLVVRVACWALWRLGVSAVCVFYDLSNAFSSIKQELLDEVVWDKAAREDGAILVQRHRCALAVLPSAVDDWQAVVPGQGDFPGDRSAPQKFILSIDGRMAKSMDDNKTGLDFFALTFEHPGTKERYSAGCATYADDIAVVGACCTAGGAKRRTETWDDEFDKVFEEAGLGQNKGKKQILIIPRGRGAKAMKKEVDQEKEGGFAGKVVKAAKHLGSWHTNKYDAGLGVLTCGRDVFERKQAAQAAWEKLGGVWHQREFQFWDLRCFYLGLVQGKLLSGCETWVCTDKQYVELERFQCKKLRAMWQGQARDWTSQELRKRSQVATIRSTMRVRRLKWLQKILRHPKENGQLMAITMGKAAWMERPQLDEEGRPTGEANPWLRQWWSDLQAAAEECWVLRERH